MNNRKGPFQIPEIGRQPQIQSLIYPGLDFVTLILKDGSKIIYRDERTMEDMLSDELEELDQLIVVKDLSVAMQEQAIFILKKGLDKNGNMQDLILSNISPVKTPIVNFAWEKSEDEKERIIGITLYIDM